MAGPDLPPWSTASRESRRSPPRRESVWHAKQLWASSGRILVVKNAASESAASRDAAQTRTRTALCERTVQPPPDPHTTSTGLGALIAGGRGSTLVGRILVDNGQAAVGVGRESVT